MHTSDHPARRSTAAALVITALFVLTQLYSAIPLIGPVSTDLGRNATFALSTSFSLCYALGFLIWGPIADHYGRRTCLLIGMTLLTVATLSCAVTTSLGALAVARCIQGITAASFSPLLWPISAIPRHPPGEEPQSVRCPQHFLSLEYSGKSRPKRSQSAGGGIGCSGQAR